MTEPLVSVIVLSYNGKKFIERCLRSLQQTNYKECELIVVDNASSDGSIELIEKKFPTVRVIRNARNEGFARANNIAASKASGDYLAFLNQDTLVDPDWLRQLMKTLLSESSIGVVGPLVINMSGLRKDKVQYLGATCDIFAHPTSVGIERDCESAMKASISVFYVPGLAMVVRRDLFELLDGFDEEYFMFVEDLDFCWRALLAGYTVKAVPTAIVYHEGGASEPGGYPGKDIVYSTTVRRVYYRVRNTLRTLLKNYSLTSLVKIMPLYLGQLMLEFMVISAFYPHVATAFFRAVYWNLSHLRDTLVKRNKVQRLRKISDRELQRFMVKYPIRAWYFRHLGIPKIVG